MGIRRNLLTTGAALAAGALLAACGGAQSTQAAPAPAVSPASFLAATDNTQLGQIVVDGAGRTLYRFDNDTASPPTSNCAGDCAARWPPVTAADGKLTVKGIDSGLVGTVKRQDGTLQLTLGGWPLYRFAQDGAAGETKGQGVGGTWFVSAPTGAKVAAAGNHVDHSTGY